MDMFVWPEVLNSKRDIIVLGRNGQGGNVICLVLDSHMSPPLWGQSPARDLEERGSLDMPSGK